ncbi:MAG: 50S ribosomal protein L13 [Proteobacteria bacterium]|nr:MAG: 50S ribosomal protein L13 [Pseudomonadota bacterium]
MKTWNAKAEEVERKWHVIDASGLKVGRLATQIATILRGKDKPIFSPNVDTGDFVVVINTDKAELSGNKMNSKKYFRHSRFFGSLKAKTAAQMQAEDSTFIIHEAVRGMLPTNKLSRQVISKMKLYTGAEHPHTAQKPELYTVTTNKK